MNNDISTHWTDDDELLGRFVLGTLPPADRAERETHLAGCERCRNAVEAERILAAGVRRLGREQLKRSLAEQVRARQPLSHPWPRILAAAAVVVIAGAVALYSRWTALQQEHQEYSGTRADSVSGQGPPVAAVRPSEPEKKEFTGSRDEKDHSPLRKEKGRVQERESPESGAVAEEVQMELSGKATAAAPAVSSEQDTAGPGQGEWWTGTHVIPGGAGDSLMSDVNPSARMETLNLESKKSAAGKTRSEYTIAQRPLDEFRRFSGRRAGLEDQTEVPIRVERRGRRVYLTLYTSSFFAKADLDAAAVTELSADSLLIQIGGTMLGVHIPGR